MNSSLSSLITEFSNLPLATKAAVALISIYLIHLLQKVSQRLLNKKPSLPPGPPGLPLVGNAYDVPAENFWEKYKEWTDEYNSDVIYLNVFGADMIVLNSLEACKELLEKRSSIYSSRPPMPMMNDLLGFDWHFAFMPYTDAWKERRKIFQKAFNPYRIEAYRPRLHKCVQTFLVQLLEDPRQFRGHIRMLAGAFILNVAYGIDVKSLEDVYIQQAERGMAGMAAAGTFSRYLVDFVPSLAYVPSWFPGAQFKRDAKRWSVDVKAMVTKPFAYAENAMKKGGSVPCLASELMEELDPNDEAYGEKRKVIQETLGAIYAAGSDSTVSSFSTFFLAMIQNPDVQKRAQGVIDEATSQLGRLPDLNNFKDLPYIEALVREILRWRPVTPIAVAHQVIEDDIYKGYHIPAGATIIPNAYAIAHDPVLYGPKPEIFDPSRFMNASQTAINPDMPMGYETFGYGRRVCPGQQLAVDSIWLVVVSVLGVFNILPAHGDKEGHVGYSSGLLIHPHPFEIRVVPRSEEALEVIRGGPGSVVI